MEKMLIIFIVFLFLSCQKEHESLTNMAYEDIEVEVKKELTLLPEQIDFKTVFLLDDFEKSEKMLKKADEALRSFLDKNQIGYSESKSFKMDNGSQENYPSPSYDIQLNEKMYRELEKYQLQHPELKGFVISAKFKDKDRENLEKQIIIEAKAKALKIADTKGLKLSGQYEMVPVQSKEEGWLTFPPLSAKINHFRQKLEGNYRFVFKAYL